MPCPPPGDLPDPGIKPISLMSPALADGFFTTNASWKAHNDDYMLLIQFAIIHIGLTTLFSMFIILSGT